MRSALVKRAFDVVVAGSALVLLSPVLAAAAVAVRVTMGSPVLFRQQRPGRHGVPFELLKFRTMSERRGRDGALLPDAERLTAVGRFLRRTSLDELPELVNVVKGEMSLVGPRPLLMEYLPLYSPEQARRHAVRPGLTGWAQVNGRNDQSWEDRFALDCWYVDHWTLRLDLEIIRRTVGAVLSGRGVSEGGHATRTNFTGGDSVAK